MWLGKFCPGAWAPWSPWRWGGWGWRRSQTWRRCTTAWPRGRDTRRCTAGLPGLQHNTWLTSVSSCFLSHQWLTRLGNNQFCQLIIFLMERIFCHLDGHRSVIVSKNSHFPLWVYLSIFRKQFKKYYQKFIKNIPFSCFAFLWKAIFNFPREVNIGFFEVRFKKMPLPNAVVYIIMK